VPTYRTAGVVLKRTNLGEADRILTILTPHHGKLKAVARGVRKIGSRLAGHLEPFSETELYLAKGRSMEVVAGARLVGVQQIEDWQQLALAYLVAEMADKLTEEGEPSPVIYGLVTEAYREIARGYADALTELRYKLGLLEALGYRVDLEVCRACGKSLEAEERYWLNNEQGGIVNGICRTSGDRELSAKQVKLWRLAFTNPVAQLRRIDEAPELAKTSLPALDGFYDYVFGKRFKSSFILKSQQYEP
jgi:DNA repair protein RecO (recombination protein O)